MPCGHAFFKLGFAALLGGARSNNGQRDGCESALAMEGDLPVARFFDSLPSHVQQEATARGCKDGRPS